MAIIRWVSMRNWLFVPFGWHGKESWRLVEGKQLKHIWLDLDQAFKTVKFSVGHFPVVNYMSPGPQIARIDLQKGRISSPISSAKCLERAARVTENSSIRSAFYVRVSRKRFQSVRVWCFVLLRWENTIGPVSTRIQLITLMWRAAKVV